MSRRINAQIQDEIDRIKHSRLQIDIIESRTITMNHDIEGISVIGLMELLTLNKFLLNTSTLDLDTKELIITRPLNADEKLTDIALHKFVESKCIKKIQSYWLRTPDMRTDLEYFLGKANILIIKEVK